MNLSRICDGCGGLFYVSIIRIVDLGTARFGKSIQHLGGAALCTNCRKEVYDAKKREDTRASARRTYTCPTGLYQAQPKYERSFVRERGRRVCCETP